MFDVVEQVRWVPRLCATERVGLIQSKDRSGSKERRCLSAFIEDHETHLRLGCVYWTRSTTCTQSTAGLYMQALFKSESNLFVQRVCAAGSTGARISRLYIDRSLLQ